MSACPSIQLQVPHLTWSQICGYSLGPKTSINKVEAVQRHATRFCQSDYRRTSSITSMLQNLGWEDLKSRREQSKTIMMYLIVNNRVEIPVEKYLIHSGTSTRGHKSRLLVPFCSVIAYKSSFFLSTIYLWNAFPASVVTAPMLDAFKSCVSVGPPEYWTWTWCLSCFLTCT